MIKKYLTILIFTSLFVACGSEEEKPRTTLGESFPEVKTEETQSANEKPIRKENPFEIPKLKTEIKSNPDRTPNIEEISVTVNVNRYKVGRAFWDNDGKPDIYGLITFSSGDVLGIPLTKNSFRAEGEAQNISLEKGDSIYVFIRDKDIDGFENIEEGVLVYKGYGYFTERLGRTSLSFKIKRKRN